MSDFPVGTILLLSGSTVPVGWAKCDGNNGTPNLINKFVFGAKVDAELKTTGGSDTHVHPEPNTGIGGAHGHANTTASITGQPPAVDAPPGTTSYKYVGRADHTHGDATITIQSDDGHEHPVPNTNSASSVPLHIQRIYIMKI